MRDGNRWIAALERGECDLKDLPEAFRTPEACKIYDDRIKEDVDEISSMMSDFL